MVIDISLCDDAVQHRIPFQHQKSLSLQDKKKMFESLGLISFLFSLYRRFFFSEYQRPNSEIINIKSFNQGGE